MANKAKHAFGSSANIKAALDAGTINERDILFLDETTDNPKVGWISKTGEIVIVEGADVSALETQVAELETSIQQKVDESTVQSMIEEHSDSLIEVVEF